MSAVGWSGPVQAPLSVRLLAVAEVPRRGHWSVVRSALRPERSARARVMHIPTAAMSRIAAADGSRRIITAGANGGRGTAQDKALSVRAVG